MSHVDEGALHAYLDGALDEFPTAEAERIRDHLDACAECAERLETERAIRTDAAAMLGMAAPIVDMPSLEELRAYVKRTRPERPAAAMRMVRMGWAASVVLALGAGWMLRGGQLEQAIVQQRDGLESQVPAVAASRDAEAAASVATEETASGFAESDSRDAGQSGDVARQVTSSATSTLAPTDVVAEAREVADDEAGLRRERSNVVELGDARSDLPATVVAEGIAAAPARLEQERAVSADLDRLAAKPGPAEATAAQRSASLPTIPEVLDSSAGAGALTGGSALTAQLDDAGGAGGRADSSAADLDLTNLAAVVANREAAPPATPSAEPAALAAGAEAPPAETVAEEERPAERRFAESPVPFTSSLTQNGRGGVRVVTESDERFKDEPSQSIAGFEVVSVTSLGEGTAQVGALVVQRLEEGAMLEIYQLVDGVMPDVLPPLETTYNEVRVEAETGWVIVRGPRSVDELEGLLARLFPG